MSRSVRGRSAAFIWSMAVSIAMKRAPRPLLQRRRMRLPDLIAFSTDALRRTRFRSGMMLLAMGLGVAAVLTLTALGEGARGYVIGEFASIGKDVVVMFPGRKETTGGMPPITGSTAREITLDEAYLL